MIAPQMGSLDAVLTVSLDNSINPAGPVRLERYAVGVHKLNNGQLERVPAAPGGAEGPRIIEAPAPIDAIATDTEQKTGGKVTVQKPTFGNDIALQFHSATDANKARKELKMPDEDSDELVIDDHAAVPTNHQLAQIALTSAIHFRVVPKASFMKPISPGPGEIFCRMRFLIAHKAAAGKQESARSAVVHTHVPGTRELLQKTLKRRPAKPCWPAPRN